MTTGTLSGHAATSDAAPDSAIAGVPLTGAAWRDLRRRPMFLISAVIVLILVAVALFPGFFAGWFGHGDPRACDLTYSALGPRSGHPFGYDLQGCDVYANVMYGARASITVGVLTTLVAVTVAVTLGCLAAMSGRLVDGGVSRLTDVFLGFPFLLGAVVILNSVSTRSPVVVALVLALFGWPTMARVVRASVLSVKQRDFITATRGLGAGTWMILRKHILPNAMAPVVVLATLSVGGVIAAEAALTYLGVGLKAPSISWGLQLASAQKDFQPHPHLLIFPASFLCVTVLAMISLGDTVRDALDPKLR